jgi:hypothetical protein
MNPLLSLKKINLAPKNISNFSFLLFSVSSIALVFSSTGAKGSYGNMLVSFFVWIFTLGISASLLVITHRLLRTILKKLNPWLTSFIEALVGSLFFAPIAYWIDVFLGSDEGYFFSIDGMLKEFGHVFLPIQICWALINSPRIFGYVRPKKLDREVLLSSDKHMEDQDIGLSGTFLERLPAQIGRDVVYLKAEKQYVKVVTTKGHALVHATFNDAILSFSPKVGLKIHRSIWVVKHHIKEIDKNSRVAIVSNGDSLPISRRLFSQIYAQV